MKKQMKQDHEYELHCGFLGNGEIIYNIRFDENNDYEKIAHISEEGQITWYKKNFPTDIVTWVENEAKKLSSQKIKWYRM